MDCDEAQLVMAVYIADDPSLTHQERQGFEAHLLACGDCRQDYRESRWILSLVREYGTISDDTRRLLESQGIPVRPPKRHMTAQECWENLKRRFPELAQLEKQHKRRKRLYRIGKITAATVALLLAFFLGWKLLGPAHSPALHASPALAQVNAIVERVDSHHLKSLPLGQPVMAKDQKQELLLGKIHRVVMNTDTALTVRADGLNGRTRYNIELAKGELYVEVLPGHPFTVRTANAQLVITGTKFNVRTKDDRTELTLVKGSVQFSNLDDQWTTVTTGHASAVLAKSVPSRPHVVDAVARICWTQEPAVNHAVAKVPSAAEETCQHLESLGLTAYEIPAVSLEALYYGQWTQEHQAFFAKNFPWVMTLEKGLRDRGIDTDCVTLLMVSGDLWQFRYPLRLDQPMGTINSAGIKRIAEFYRIDPSVFDSLLPQAKIASLHDPQAYREALRHWQKDIQEATHQAGMPGDLATFTFRAVNYLLATHTAAWLWIKDYPALAQRLVADQAYATIFPIAFPPKTTPTPQTWLAGIHENVSVLQAAGDTACNLFIAALVTTCSPPARELHQRLMDKLLPLMPNEPGRDLSVGGSSQ